ncbi:MAG TPA: epoxide hydrolase N-terminal domain-containing protein [Actinomycetota bacterium]|nr:epoxide hydrolase N-terminal domain-containing protein [Actinomycetota bacterium]
MGPLQPTPFAVDVPDDTLADLRGRLARTRWADEVGGAGWDYGTNLAYLRALCAYWRDGFDWRAQERALNRLPQFRATVEGSGSISSMSAAAGPDPFPLLVTHGWPSSFVEFRKLIPLLADPGGRRFPAAARGNRRRGRGGGHGASLVADVGVEAVLAEALDVFTAEPDGGA